MAKQRSRTSRIPRFIRQHSLSIPSATILVLWIGLYSGASPGTHLGSFFGNAIADWSGVLVMVFATKYLYEKGSAESRRPPQTLLGPVWERLRNHSLSIFFVITGIGWIALYASMDSETKWGQVVGNIVSEWTQVFGLVLLTKRLIERHSRESSR
jgi:putative Mn2+ efflux pump MntP